MEGQGEEPGGYRPLKEGLIHILEVVLEDVVEVALGLVGVETEGEENWWSVGSGHQFLIKPRGSRSVERTVRRWPKALSMIRKKSVWAS